jgi:NADP-dependent 3-hydroxy acid dehydrogenase YdfG
VLAARSAAHLQEIAAQCIGLGGEAIAVVTDVRDEHAVQHLADEAVAGYGRIDVWVNGAGVIAYDRFEDLPSDVFRAVIETNLLGQVNGARAALQCFRRQDDGTLINWIGMLLGIRKCRSPRYWHAIARLSRIADRCAAVASTTP